MKDKTVYTKVGTMKIKVGTFRFDENTGEMVFIKNRPHYMRVLDGYGIQRHVEDEKGREWDLVREFGKNKDTVIRINDPQKGFYETTAGVWMERGVAKNYGNGQQIFLSVKYMNKTNVSEGR